MVEISSTQKYYDPGEQKRYERIEHVDDAMLETNANWRRNHELEDIILHGLKFSIL